MISKISIVFIVLLTLLCANLTWAQGKSIVELSDTITGNQEQPKVLYIVPWKAADDNTILYQQLKTRLQRDVFKHIERSEHLREIKYINQLSEAAKNTQ